MVDAPCALLCGGRPNCGPALLTLQLGEELLDVVGVGLVEGRQAVACLGDDQREAACGTAAVGDPG